VFFKDERPIRPVSLSRERSPSDFGGDIRPLLSPPLPASSPPIPAFQFLLARENRFLFSNPPYSSLNSLSVESLRISRMGGWRSSPSQPHTHRYLSNRSGRNSVPFLECDTGYNIISARQLAAREPGGWRLVKPLGENHLPFPESPIAKGSLVRAFRRAGALLPR